MILDKNHILEVISNLVEEVKKDGYGEVVFKTIIQNGKIMTSVIYKTITFKIT